MPFLIALGFILCFVMGVITAFLVCEYYNKRIRSMVLRMREVRENGKPESDE